MESGFVDLRPWRRHCLPIPRLVNVNTHADTYNIFGHAAEQLLSNGMSLGTLTHLVCNRLVNTSSCCTGIAGDIICNSVVEGGIRQFIAKLPVDASDAPRTLAPLHFVAMWTCECSKKRQEELLALPSHMSPKHIFGDIREFVPESMRQSVGLDGGVELPARELKFALAYATMRRRAWCVKHGRYCTIDVSDFHSSSPPCTDDSKSGLVQKEDGRQRKIFYIFVGMRRTLREPFVRIENVVDFGTHEVEELLGDLYIVIGVITDAPDYGYCQNRRRLDIHLILKVFGFAILKDHHPEDVISTQRVIDMYDAPATIRELFHRRCNFTWADLLHIGN